MAEEIEATEEATEEVAEVTEEVTTGEATEEITDDVKPEGEGDVKDTKTLLSDDEGDGAGGAPDKYEYVSPKDIGEIDMTPEVQAQFDNFNERAKDADLTQDQYQKLVDGEIRRGRAAVDDMVVGYQQRVDGWADQTKADKELGGEELAENLSTAKLGMDTFGTPALKALLDKPSEQNPDGLGIGNHPEIIRLLHRAGLQVKEDGDLVGGDGGKAENDASLRRMYPSMFKDEAA
jgi:hypothetical protein